MMKKISILTALPAVLLLLTTFPLRAATDKEMEEARTYAAQAYLRYANDASGYLDEISVKTLSELKGKLKAQELENLKAVEAIGLPQGYAAWDKEKLSEYWSQTFFASPGLLEKGRNGGAKARVKRKIASMTVTANASAAEKETEAAKPEEKMGDPLESLEAGSATDAAAIPDSLEQAALELEQAMAEEELASHKAGNSHTWIYIGILIVLIGVVIWLVVFASKVMKRNEQSDSTANDEEIETLRRENERLRRQPRSDDGDATRLQQENESLHHEIARLRQDNERMHRDMEETSRLQQEYNRLRENYQHLQSENNQLTTRLQQLMSAPAHQPHQAPAPQPAPAPASQPAAPSGPRTIFLGRANARQLFVRADRKLNIGHTIFRLDTSDGFAGTFRVAADPAVWEMAMLNPTEHLAGACTAPDIEETTGMNRIVTDSPGTAIFENGCWKVIRKARIHYEP